MISYLGIINLSSELVGQYNTPNLLHLVGLTFVAAGFQVQNFYHSRAHEDVGGRPERVPRIETRKQPNHAHEWNIGVGISSENLLEKLFGSRHDRAQD
jgi:hypothetical protein